MGGASSPNSEDSTLAYSQNMLPRQSADLPLTEHVQECLKSQPRPSREPRGREPTRARGREPTTERRWDRCRVGSIWRSLSPSPLASSEATLRASELARTRELIQNVLGDSDASGHREPVEVSRLSEDL